MKLVDIAVVQRVSVGIALKHTVPLDNDILNALEDLVIGNVLVLPVVDELRHALSGKHHIAGIPRELIAPWIVIRLGRHQTACERLEGVHLSSLLAHPLQYSRDHHVINSRINTALHHD